MKKLVVSALSFSLLLSYTHKPALAAGSSAPSTIEELKTERLKSLIKRAPQVEELLQRAQSKLDQMKQAKADPELIARLRTEIDRIIFSSVGVIEARLKTDIELLNAFVKDHKEPGADELAPLQERYKKLCSQFDEMVFHKDLDRAFHIHDKLVRFTAVGVWDKDKISSEMERIETLVENAPDIAFGRAQLLDTCKNKKLAFVPKLVYLGSSSHEEMYLTADRRSVAIIDEGCGAPLNMELSEHLIQNPDGSLSNLNDADIPALGIPFSPPVSLWAKTRLLEGRVPAIQLRMVDEETKASHKAYAKSGATFFNAADIAAGKTDDYFKANLAYMGVDKTPTLLGLFVNFDREPAATAFGADGHTPYYTILDPKLKDLEASKLADELQKRFSKGVFAGAKGTAPELCNQYGDANIPDGPERVRDSWKRLSKIVNETGSTSVALFSSAGSFHGNKNAGKFEGEQTAGNQAWNKLEYYWPGEAVLDWVGINGVGKEPAVDPKGANIMEALEPFMAEQRSSAWQATPVMLVNLSPARAKAPLAESAWISTMFNKVIPSTFPNILAVFINVLDDVTLWSVEAKGSFRSFVSSNKFYNYKMRFKILDAGKPADTAAGSK